MNATARQGAVARQSVIRRRRQRTPQRLARKSIYLRVVDLFAQNLSIDFVDCLNVAHMEYGGIREVWTFDKDYARRKGVGAILSREP